MNRSRDKGTKWETAIVNTLIDNGWPYAERRRPNGNYDRGDIAGIPAVVIEAKDEKRIDLSGWLNEAEAERANDKANLGVVWFKRRGRSSAGKGYVLMDGDTFMQLLKDAGYGPNPTQSHGRKTA